MSKHSRMSARQKRTPRGVHLSVHNRDRESADEALQRQLREERRQEALDEARAEQARLDRRIEREKAAPAMGQTLGAVYAAEQAPLTDALAQVLVDEAAPLPTPVDTPPLALLFPDLSWEGDGKETGVIGAARVMLRQGYNVRKVVTMYGIGLKWLDDIPIDEMGFGVPTE